MGKRGYETVLICVFFLGVLITNFFFLPKIISGDGSFCVIKVDNNIRCAQKVPREKDARSSCSSVSVSFDHCFGNPCASV